MRDYAKVMIGLASPGYAEGPDLATLEAKLAERAQTAEAVAVPLARTGLYLIFKHLIPRGRKIIMSPYTVSEVVNMAICAGLKPVFADIDSATCNISPEAVDAMIDDETGGVLVTHFYGLICEVERIGQICQDRGIPMIEDAAQAFGAQVDGRPAGSFGDAAVFSFNLYKSLSSFLGGAIVTENADLAEKVRVELAGYPVMPKRDFLKSVVSGLITDLATHPLIYGLLTYRVLRFGFLRNIDAINNRVKNDIAPVRRQQMPSRYLTRTSNLQARLILPQLTEIEDRIYERIECARIYDAGLRDIEEISIPPFRDDGSHCYWYYPIQFSNRANLVAMVMKDGCDIGPSYHRNCADMTCFQEFNQTCPAAASAAQAVVYLPTYPGYPHAAVRRNILAIRRYFGRR